MDDAAQELRDIDSGVEYANNEIIDNSVRWIIQNVDDQDLPFNMFSHVLRTAIFKSSDPAYVGQFVIDMAQKIVRDSVKAGIDS